VTRFDITGSKPKGFLSSRREEIIESQYIEIKKLESKYCKLYDEAPEMYRTINTSGTILECNQSYVTTLGYSSKDEVIGHSIFEHVSPDSLNSMQESFEEWKRAGAIRNREVWFKRKDDSTFPVLISANNLYDDNGQLIGSNSVIIDETEMYTARKELELARNMQQEFINIAAHELRTPIQPILSYVELARKNVVGKEKALDAIYLHARRLARLATDILDLTKIESGTLQYQMCNINCNELIENAASIAKAQLGSIDSRVRIITELNRTASLNVLVDPERIIQVITNILNNAIKFTNEGTITISTSLDSVAGKIKVEIRDTGRGIPDNIIPRLFHKFATSSNVDGNNGGTGLGLHLAAKIIEYHKGTIWGKNNEGSNGATFGFSLSMKQQDNEE
jgi:PAS domain S-box-containing protein